MDCEKFEPLLLDELYDELDELTSAAVRRHVSGCARCGGILNGLRSTRRGISLPMVPVPEGLEDRILAAAREAQKVVPIKSRMSRALSVAGNWAMRPQTAMAAVFLLMIGTSAFLIRSKNYASRGSAFSVTVEGAPAQTAAAPVNEVIDDKAAAAAHGPSMPIAVAPPPPPAPEHAAASAVASNEDSFGGGPGAKAKDKGFAGDLAALTTPAATTSPPAAAANAAAPAGAPYDDGLAQAPAKVAAGKRAGPSDELARDPFSLGAAAFRARNFAEAARQFDQAAQAGDTNAALWAAESVREGQGCAVALGRFDQLAQRAAGSWVGSEASLRAARCQIHMAQFDPARDRLNKLAQTSSHQAAAQQLMNELQVAQARKAGGGAAGGAAAAPRRAVPASRPQAPARAPAVEAEKKSLDSNHGY